MNRQIEINEQFRQALYVMEHTPRSIFITGRAGTGKSTLLNLFCETTTKKVVVLAPTGVAALNVKGRTIHSFFGFRPNITVDMIKRQRTREGKESIYKKLDTIIIDEISMVRADLLDCVDRFLMLNGPDENKPFGGIQMVFIGDLYQLPPVISSREKEIFKTVYESPYFYNAKVFSEMEVDFIELDKVYRQQDADFISLLNAIRNRSIDNIGLAAINRRCRPEFLPKDDDHYVYLTTTNLLAESINTSRLANLNKESKQFTAQIEGQFDKEYLPTKVELELKEGAQVMMLNNDIEGRWVNGSIGEIASIGRKKDGDEYLIIDLSNGNVVTVTPYTWEIYNYQVEQGILCSEIIGTFTQFPVMLSWAVTIHKSQGKTFDRVIIDFGKGTFAHGQAYVALSRCTSLDGIVLTQPLRLKDILMDFDVVHFLARFQYHKAEISHPLTDKMVIIKEAIGRRSALEIVYLKPNDEKSRRVIRPIELGEMQFKNKQYIGVRAFCLTRNEFRTFRVDRILEIKEME